MVEFVKVAVTGSWQLLFRELLKLGITPFEIVIAWVTFLTWALPVQLKLFFTYNVTGKLPEV